MLHCAAVRESFFFLCCRVDDRGEKFYAAGWTMGIILAGSFFSVLQCEKETFDTKFFNSVSKQKIFPVFGIFLIFAHLF